MTEKDSLKRVKRSKKKAENKFPRITIEEAVEIIKKVKNEYRHEIIPYKRFATDILGQKSPKGGTYQIKIEALKLYGLMNRHSYEEIAILPSGSKILKTENEEEKKKLMFERILSVPIIKKIYDKFNKKLPEKKQPIMDFLISEGLTNRDATMLANLILKENKTYKSFIPLYLSKAIIPETPNKTTWVSEDISSKATENAERVEGLAPLIRIIGSLFPLESDKKINEKLDTLSKLAKDHNLRTFYGLIEGLKISDDPEKIKSFSKKIISTFQDDSGIKIAEDKDIESDKEKPQKDKFEKHRKKGKNDENKDKETEEHKTPNSGDQEEST